MSMSHWSNSSKDKAGVKAASSQGVGVVKAMVDSLIQWCTRRAMVSDQPKKSYAPPPCHPLCICMCMCMCTNYFKMVQLPCTGHVAHADMAVKVENERFKVHVAQL